MDRIRPSHLSDLLIAYPQARFVLMHIGYPYTQEVLALAKHFANVYADLCWAWSFDPQSSMEFVRRFIHTAPINKLFGFGGDTLFPPMAVGYAMQMRKWLKRALTAEVEDGEMSEMEAMKVATRLLRQNQYECFDVEAKRRAARAAMAIRDRHDPVGRAVGK
jgi:predicted TIM-barrel fold metal-dependent hydrolase